jgi:hypothetical protein
VYGGGSSSYVSKASSERRISKGLSSSCRRSILCPLYPSLESSLTDGTFAGSVCEEAASVVTSLKAGRAAGAMTLRRNGEAMLRLIVLDSIVVCGGEDGEG